MAVLFSKKRVRDAFYTINILDKNSYEIANKFINLLSKNNVESGKALQHAESIYIERLKEKRKDIVLKNFDNVRKYREDICKALNVELEDEDMYTDFFLYKFDDFDIDHVNNLELINRGFCPICGDNSITKKYHRYILSSIQYLCKDCYERIYPPFPYPKDSVSLAIKGFLKVFSAVIVISLLITLFLLIFNKKGMMVPVGIIIVLIGSIFRGWGILNRRRQDFDQPLIFGSLFFQIFLVFGQIFLGLLASLLIGVGSTFWIGLVSFVLFWIFSYIWCPIISLFGF